MCDLPGRPLLSACILALAVLPAQAQFERKPWPRQRPVPALALRDLDGQLWTLPRLKGRVVLLNFWATWCEPCRDEMPALVQLAQQTPPEQLLVLTVNYQENEARIRSYLQSLDVPLPVLLDRDGLATRAWTARIFPTTVLLGTDGRPRQVVTGPYDWSSQDALRLLAPLLASAGR